MDKHTSLFVCIVIEKEAKQTLPEWSTLIGIELALPMPKKFYEIVRRFTSCPRQSIRSEDTSRERPCYHSRR
jgi:hypothetical protein